MILDVAIAAKRFGSRCIVRDLHFSVGAREVVALVGPSGCGKTTLLRLIGGLDTAFDGRIGWTGGRIGTVFQEPRLLPWRTVRDNLTLVDPPGGPAAVDALLAELGLAPHRDVFPPRLSLGMARRVAIARALAVDPDLLLLDEPFVSLDPPTAARGKDLLLHAWRARPLAVLLVTHDLAEAAALADRILLLSADPMRLIADIAVPDSVRRAGPAPAASFAAALLAEHGYFKVSR